MRYLLKSIGYGSVFLGSDIKIDVLIKEYFNQDKIYKVIMFFNYLNHNLNLNFRILTRIK